MRYLLEKSRAVRPGKGERAYHIFYQLLTGAPPKARDALLLNASTASGRGEPADFAYLSCSEVCDRTYIM